MKLRIIFISMIMVLVSTMALYANGLKYYPVSSAEWQRVNDICRYAGVSGPSSFGPVTAQELSIALDRAASRLGDDNQLVTQMRAVLSNDKALHKDDIGYIDLSLELTPELYVQTSAEKSDTDFMPDMNWAIKRYKDRNPLASIRIETGLYDSVYGQFVMLAKQKNASEMWTSGFSTNVPTQGMAKNFPFEAGLSLGFGGFSLILARDKVSLGEGKTGNTAIGDVFDYQEFMRGGFSSRVFSAHLNLTYFDSSRRDLSKATDRSGLARVNNPSFSGWKQIRHTADYSLVLFDRLKTNLALICLLDTDSAFDARLLNPFMILHSMNNYHEHYALEANNLIYMDLSYSFAPKWNVYAQFSMDQFQISGESGGYIEEFGYTEPNAFGTLMNLSYTDVISDGVFSAYGEFVCNWPGLYLNEKYYKYGTDIVTQHRYRDAEKTILNDPCWSQDYLVGYSRTDEGTGDNMAFAGYTYGPDCIVGALGAKYSVYGKYDVQSRLQYVAHGQKGRGNSKGGYDFSGLDTESTVNKMPLQDEEVEHTLSFALEGSYSFFDWLSVYAGAAFVYRINANFSGEKTSNLQVALGARISTP